MSDLIDRQAAIRWVKTECNPYGNPTLDFESGKKVIKHLEQMPSAEPTNVHDILEYLNTVLHPIVSPEHWNVYSELHDMISALPSAEPEIIRCNDCEYFSKRTDYTGMCDLRRDYIFTNDYCSYAVWRNDERFD